MKRPNFFIVGAPKCGTTSMYQYLRQHPDIFMPDRKELHFFASDLDLERYYSSLQEYIEEFACTTKTLSGEGTTWYLYSETAAKEIRAFNSDAKIIISLRDPIDMVYSLFRFRRYVGIEKLGFLSNVLEREQKYIVSFQEYPTKHNYIYARAALYYQQVQRYTETFGPTRVHVVVFEDVKDNPEKVYRDMLRFLEVSDDFRPAFRNVNRTGRIRSESLRERLKQPPSVVRSAARVLPQRVRRKAYWALRRMNVSYAPPPPLDPELRRRLAEEFRPDVERLSTLIGRDLTHWFRK